jgi:NADPH-dependent 2,4-dienoyl-CoA reductase/sulfur reductase-like enzyme
VNQVIAVREVYIVALRRKQGVCPSQLIMEHTRVVIVGAGPAGLVAGLSLAQHGIAVSSPVTPFLATMAIADYAT